MKLVNFYREQQLCLGVMTDKGMLDMSSRFDMDRLLTAGEQEVQALRAYAEGLIHSGDVLFLHEEQIRYAPCVPNSRKIICIGLNYRRHAEESGMNPPEEPLLFSKFSNALAAHQEDIELPAESRQVDYEAELGIVIGRKVRNISKEDALSAVFGYCCANDLSARDLQFRSSQWLLGKSCDGFAPCGPYLITADEVPSPNKLEIRTLVNGEVRQSSNTSDMIFHCDEIISYISRHMTLEPGDLILTGTPEGVIMGLPESERVWLRDGDTVTVEIEGLGSLTNRLVKP
ncbi:fumarylacetoacetate hydrolase family protein [Paenibacillus sp. J22TS3]|uniref:fumarylacetoacetate hydrolase family protein n=1 Tax=Paenibacillus sp. J22TS3 TaxID=2807192 RepID=UPI001B18F99E|nr:fumarylacetoacetate hydrolase family protein [Paenibacillus sp. J22TS3]GIP22526.1 2-hydroxyhepta-2,4-diene-1,7-dioate isomerase [Paenibacillus sp. J22TS3]